MLLKQKIAVGHRLEAIKNIQKRKKYKQTGSH
ncbi:MAG: hypothetical protein ACJAUT_001114 [Cellvibrionaceae bacterium]|jgi:hypothetical protein